MHTFADRNGRQWQIDLTIGTVARVRKESGKRFDLLDPSSLVDGAKLSTVLDEDLATVYEVLWHIVEPQAAAAGITAEKFGEAMAADCIVSAQAALFAEWLDFFRAVQRPDLATALDMMTTARARLAKAVAAKMATIDVEATKTAMQAKIDQTLGQSFGGLQDRLASILAQ